jgi:hypothetical protein
MCSYNNLEKTTNSGSGWSQLGSSGSCEGVAISSDGTKMLGVATSQSGFMYSSNSGSTFSTRASGTYFMRVAASSDFSTSSGLC